MSPLNSPIQHFILIDRKPVPCPDLLTWARWFESNNRNVKKTNLPNIEPWKSADRLREIESARIGEGMGLSNTRFRTSDLILISTVFLGLDHSFSTEGPPILFETMVFNGPLHGDMDRYETWDAAITGHEATVKRVQQMIALTGGDNDTEQTICSTYQSARLDKPE